MKIRRRVLVLVLTAVLASGCSPRASEDDGYAAQAQAEADAAARATLPLLVVGEMRLNPGRTSFVRCDVSGWRYEGDADVFGTLQVDAVEVLGDAGLEVRRRDDGSVVGQRGELSVLVGGPTGPPARPFRHVTFRHACARYSDADTAYAEETAAGDYAAYVEPERLFTG